MGFFSEYFRDRRYLNLADTKQETKIRASRPMSVDNKAQLNRVTKDVIRELYHRDWFTFSQVNVVTSLFSRPKIEVISDDKDSWEAFFENMRRYGTNTSLKRLRAEVKRDAVAYGAGYIEYIWDESGSEIVDLKRVDASKIEHAKDNRKDYFILDTEGMSIGYIMHLGPNADLTSKGDPIPSKYSGIINIRKGDIFLAPERIAEFPLYKLGNDTEALGVVEPAVQQTQRRRNLETSQVNALWINGSGLPYMKVGSETHEPTPQMMEDALDMVANIRTSQAIAIPHYNEFDTIAAKLDGSSNDIMDNLMAASAGAGNVPLPFITGAGQATNRSTLKTQREIFELSIQEKIDAFDQDWNNQIMEKVGSINNYASGKILSEEIRLESKDETVKRLKTYYEMNSLAPEEIREYVLATETIQRDDNAYKKFSQVAKQEKVNIKDEGKKIDGEKADDQNEVNSGKKGEKITKE